MSTATMFRGKLAARGRCALLPPGALRAREVRHKLWAVFTAIAEAIPASGDEDGQAAGVLTIAEIAERAKQTRTWTRHALTFFRTNRVLWLRYQAGTVEARFERRVIIGLLAAQKVAPLEVRKLIEAHRRRREAAAPCCRTEKIDE